MLDLALNLPARRVPRFLFVGSHADDIEIGCGGTVLQLIRRYPSARIDWVVLSAGKARSAEAKRAAKLLTAGLPRVNVTIKDFRESHFPSQIPQLKACFEELKASTSPDVVFSHYGQDLHQDHRVVSEVTWNTFRDHLILEYEIPKYDGGLGSPSVFVAFDERTVRRKVGVLMKAFPTQATKRWFTPETFRALMRLRGIECNSDGGYAEAFYVRKLMMASGLRGPGARTK